jgi:two-component system response regulator NreC
MEEQPEAVPAKLRLLLVDDHVVVRLGLRFVLEHTFDCEVVECGDARQAVGLALGGGFNLVILDVRLGDPDGLWALGQIRAERADIPVLMISTYAAPDYVQGAIDKGANGYLMKEATTMQLQEAVTTAISGKGLYLHPAAAEAVRARPVAATTFGDLSERELEVLRMVALGYTNNEIGTALYCSEKTVKSRLTSILRKLGFTNRTQAAAFALREGLVDSGANRGLAAD